MKGELKMDVNEIASKGRLFNIVIILVNAVTYISYFMGRFSDSTAVWVFQTICRVGGVVAAIVCIIYAAILIKNNEGRLKGLGLLLASSIVSLIFSALGFMLGLVIWILSGISMSQLQKSLREHLDTQLYSDISDNIHQKNMAGFNNNYGDDPFAANNRNYSDPFANNNQQQNYSDPFANNNQNYSDPFANNPQGYGNTQNYSDPFANNPQGYSNAQNYSDPFAGGSKGYGDDNQN